MRKRTGEVVKGFGTEFIKVPQFADILKEERKNARTFINRPARYVFLAENIVTAEAAVSYKHRRVQATRPGAVCRRVHGKKPRG